MAGSDVYRWSPQSRTSRVTLPDFRCWHIASVSAVQRHIWSWGKTGSNRTTVKMALMVESRCGAVALGSNISVFRLFRLAVPYWFGHSSVSTSRSSVGSRTGAPARHATFPVPSTSHAACGFPALRAPICFTPTLMGPILLGRLSARRVALDRR